MKLGISWIESKSHRQATVLSAATTLILWWAMALSSTEMSKVEETNNWPAFQRMVRGNNSWRRRQVVLVLIKTNRSQHLTRRIKCLLAKRFYILNFNNLKFHIHHQQGSNIHNCPNKKVLIGIIHQRILRGMR